MSDRPIIFSAPMIRALLDGRKTQTRRVLKPHGDTFSAPSYRRGDRLYVREAAHIDGTSVNYRADHPGDSAGLGWRPSIHMPRWASRITLEITGVRVERLQDISPFDCEAEGVQRLPLQDDQPQPWWTADVSAGPILHSRSALGAYHRLWETINGPDSWDANPWVWVVEFKRQEEAA
mgnify:CR=1 FL=1